MNNQITRERKLASLCAEVVCLSVPCPLKAQLRADLFGNGGESSGDGSPRLAGGGPGDGSSFQSSRENASQRPKKFSGGVAAAGAAVGTEAWAGPSTNVAGASCAKL